MAIEKKPVTANAGLGAGDAENGLSVVNPAPGVFRIVLGNDVGNTDAILLNDREIPSDGHYIALSGGGGLLLNSTTNQGTQVLQANGSILQYDEQTPVVDYVITDIMGNDPLSNRPGITCRSSGGNVGLTFFAEFYSPNAAAVLLGTTSAPIEDQVICFDSDNATGGELGIFCSSGNGFWGNLNFIQDNGINFQVYGTAFFDGNVGFVNAAATARVHITGGTGANNGALKIDPVIVTVPENNLIENDGTNPLYTTGGVRYALLKSLTVGVILSFPNTLAQNYSDLTVAFVGAVEGDHVLVSMADPVLYPLTGIFTGFVSAPDQVTVRFNNYSGGAVDPTDGVGFAITLIKLF